MSHVPALPQPDPYGLLKYYAKTKLKPYTRPTLSPFCEPEDMDLTDIIEAVKKKTYEVGKKYKNQPSNPLYYGLIHLYS